MLHIIQNDPEVPPGNLTETLMTPYCLHHPYRNEPLPKLQDISALIVLGGAMGANDDQRYPFLTDLKALIRAVVAARVPYLGICLGGQLLAAALGATVISNRWEEQGTLPVTLTESGQTDRLFSGITPTFSTFQWHHDSFDLPVHAELLALSSVCPHQAFRVGSNAWGVQFHPEVTTDIIGDWCAWSPDSAAQATQLLADFRHAEHTYATTAHTIWQNFVQTICQTTP